MVNYMVALDGSKNAHVAFETAINMLDKKRDQLFLLTVVDHIQLTGMGSESLQSSLQEQAKNTGKALLVRYAKLCKEKGVTYHCTEVVSNHIGESVCQQVDRKAIDCLVMGRRGMSAIKRFFTGSTSRYVVEHANCNVVIVKGEWGPSEEHSNLDSIKQQEENERDRRIQETKQQEEDERKKEKFQSDLDKNIVRIAEEEERQRRIKEDQQLTDKEKKDREAAHIGAVIAEEEERQRRIKEDGIIDDRHHHVEMLEDIY